MLLHAISHYSQVDTKTSLRLDKPNTSLVGLMRQIANSLDNDVHYMEKEVKGFSLVH